MPINNPTHRKLTKTPMYMENLSFDPVHEVLTRIPLTLNPVSGSLERTTGIQGNSSYALAYDGNGNLQTLTKTISGTNYVKTFTWVDGVLTSISVWV